MPLIELCSDMIDLVLDVLGIYGLPAETQTANTTANTFQEQMQTPTPTITTAPATSLVSQVGELEDDEFIRNNDDTSDPTAYDKESASVIRLSNGMVLYLKEVDTMLALVCITRGDFFCEGP